MATVQQLATWASIAAKIDTFPKLPSGGGSTFF
nr:MAG TPA: hypothetical protein [Caudoviricetes sp.]